MREAVVNLSAHFTMAEFTASGLARRKGIDNTLPASLLVSAQSTCDMLERVRAHLTHLAGHPVPITLTSGYRCPALNAAVGSSDTSDHLRACAADFVASAFGTPYQVACALAPHVGVLGIGQLIHEFGDWIHVSTAHPAKHVNRIITISKAGVMPGIQDVA
jgi:zinc D-Ala-D-Ala carboxypeptidase